ncbi:DUF2264 domain-containing protein [Rhodococcus ruber]|uniref:DUF2264 domain-containing protein n=1 Tax=Rhodococcus ruber TaxID=1830 RepID=UPI003989FCC7
MSSSTAGSSRGARRAHRYRSVVKKKLARRIADEVLVRAYSSPASSVMEFPRSKWGKESDAYEYFARVLLLGAMRGRGARLDDGSAQEIVASRWCSDVRATVARSLGRVDHRSWWRLSENPQSIVETASLALAVRLFPEGLWEPLEPQVRDRLVEWFRHNVGRNVSENNWIIFPKLIAETLVSVGAGDERCAGLIDECAHRTDSWYLGNGLYSDGPGRTVDYYSAWAFNFYLPLSAYLSGNEVECAKYRERVSDYSSMLRFMIDPVSGSPCYVGRSLIYRFGVAAPLALNALTSPGSRQEASDGALWGSVVSHFLQAGALSDGRLSVGWHRGDPRLRQRYSGYGSPYWAFKSFVSLLIPEESAFWSSSDDTFREIGTRVARGAGVASSNVGGVAALYNHGVDHQKEHRRSYFVDDPLYVRGAYSSRTVPVGNDGIPDNSMCLGVGSNYSGRGSVRPEGAGEFWLVSSFQPVFTKRFFRLPIFKYGKLDGLGPRVHPIGSARITDVSVFLGDSVVRAYFCSGSLGVGQGVARALLSGWALPEHSDTWSIVDAPNLVARLSNSSTSTSLRSLLGFDSLGIHRIAVVSPFSSHALVPVLSTEYADSAVYCAVSRICDRSVTSDGVFETVSVVSCENSRLVLGTPFGEIRLSSEGVI